MQSGIAKTAQWVLEIESAADRRAEPLMGWVQSSDTMEQIRLKFDTLESAQAFAQSKGLEYSVLPPREKRIKPRNYGDNFKYIPADEA